MTLSSLPRRANGSQVVKGAAKPIHDLKDEIYILQPSEPVCSHINIKDNYHRC